MLSASFSNRFRAFLFPSLTNEAQIQDVCRAGPVRKHDGARAEHVHVCRRSQRSNCNHCPLPPHLRIALSPSPITSALFSPAGSRRLHPRCSRRKPKRLVVRPRVLRHVRAVRAVARHAGARRRRLPRITLQAHADTRASRRNGQRSHVPPPPLLPFFNATYPFDSTTANLPHAVARHYMQDGSYLSRVAKINVDPMGKDTTIIYRIPPGKTPDQKEILGTLRFPLV